MDMRDWMKGDLPLYPHLESSEPQATRYYGLFRTRKGLRPFITLRKDRIPRDTVEVRTAQGKATDLVKAMLLEYERTPISVQGQVSEPIEESYVGRVGNHTDGGRVHTLICLWKEGEDCAVLFLSAHSRWNPFARRLTQDESIFIGFPRNETSLAPVFRSFSEIYWTDRYFPDHRVEDLKKEFFRPDRIPRIRKF